MNVFTARVEDTFSMIATYATCPARKPRSVGNNCVVAVAVAAEVVEDEDADRLPVPFALLPAADGDEVARSSLNDRCPL